MEEITINYGDYSLLFKYEYESADPEVGYSEGINICDVILKSDENNSILFLLNDIDLLYINRKDLYTKYENDILEERKK